MIKKLFSSQKENSFYYPGQEIRPSTMTRAHMEGSAKKIIEVCKTRVIVTSCAFAFVFITIGFRMINVAFPDKTRLQYLSYKAPVVDMTMKRADITDRNGTILATSLPTVNLYANPRVVLDAEFAAKKLSDIFEEIDYKRLKARLSSNKSFVYIKRNLTPKEQYDVNSLGLPGINFENGEKRVYPQGGLVSHLIGITNIDNHGISGVEKEFDERLLADSAPLKISIDASVQDATRSILEKNIKKYDAVGGVGIVSNVNTGEILSLVSKPDFDPNNLSKADQNSLFNRATLGVYEVGSIFKVFNTALALDSEKIKVTDKFDARKPLKLAKYKITDYHAENRWLSVPEILVHSSNIGSAKMALKVGKNEQKDFFDKIGMFQKTSIELPERGSPILPDRWRDISTATISYGYGVAVTPVHAISALASIVNGGIYYPATLLLHEEGEKPMGRRIMSDKNSKTMRKLLRMVVTDGSGRNANISGYEVGGKTGTAEKLTYGKYVNRKVRTSFVGAFPMNKPKYAVFVMLDEPKATENTFGFNAAGWNAVPTAKEIIETIAPQLNIKPVIGKKEQNLEMFLKAHAIIR